MASTFPQKHTSLRWRWFNRIFICSIFSFSSQICIHIIVHFSLCVMNWIIDSKLCFKDSFTSLFTEGCVYELINICKTVIQRLSHIIFHGSLCVLNLFIDSKTLFLNEVCFVNRFIDSKLCLKDSFPPLFSEFNVLSLVIDRYWFFITDTDYLYVYVPDKRYAEPIFIYCYKVDK